MLTLNPVTSAVYQQNTSNQPDEVAPARYHFPRLGSYHELNMPLQLEPSRPTISLVQHILASKAFAQNRTILYKKALTVG